MDSRLILTLLFVTLAGGFMGTYAQSTTTTTNMTTTSMTTTSMTTNNMTTTSMNATSMTTNNMTTTSMTTNNMNATSMTTNNMNATSMTTTNMNATSMTTNNMNATSMTTNNMNATSMTTNNMNATSMTTNNMTTANMTTTNMTTAVPTTTTPAPIVANETVTNLTTAISRSECGISQLCASEPSDCDPSSGTCFFLGAERLGGQNFRFALSGESDGYIAATLSPATTLGGNDTSYICANDKGVVRYLSALLDNGKLILKSLRVNNVRGRVNGKNIQCQFDATLEDFTSTRTRAATNSTTFSISVSTGTYNASSGDLGSPTFKITTGLVDLRNVNATTTNLLNSTNTNTTTTGPSTSNTTTAGNAVTIQQSIMQALLITVGVLSLTWL